MGDRVDQQQEDISQAESPGQTLFTSSQDYSAKPDHTSRSNLPAQLTPLIGREQTIITACTLLRRHHVRLVTFIGTGGIGKTSLALQVARDLDSDFADGVCFVSLAPISDPDLVIPTITQEFGLKEIGQQLLLDLLKAYLSNKHLLLLLDNFEQVITAAPTLSILLEACPHLKILVTSRAALHLHGEHEFPVPSLALPDLTHMPASEALSQVAAVALFLQRTQAVKPDMQLTTTNARAIAEICVRLDGLPLAIELAAARMKLFPPQALLARLSSRLQMLTSGTQDAPTRQQTLRNTIAWSYHLLNAQEQQLFRQLSIFVGGCTLQAAEAVYSSPGENHTETVLDGITSLIDKSLLQQTEQESEEPRFLMLETIREYGLECLTVSGEEEATRRAHAMYHLRFVEEVEPKLGGPQQIKWLERLEQEHDNLRATMQWSLEQGETKQHWEMAWQLGDALQWFWQRRGHLSEGRRFLDRTLVRSHERMVLGRAKALNAAGMIATFQVDIDQVELLCKESLALFQQLEDKQGIAFSLFWLASVAGARNNLDEARLMLEEAMTLHNEVRNTEYIAWSLYRLAELDMLQGKYSQAHVLNEECLGIHRKLENTWGIAYALVQLARLLFYSENDSVKIHDLFEEGIALYRALGDKKQIAFCRHYLAEVALYQGNTAMAYSLIEESITVRREMGDPWARISMDTFDLLAKISAVQGDYKTARTRYEEGLALIIEKSEQIQMPFYLEGLADVVAIQGEFIWAAQLWGIAETLREAFNVPIIPILQAGYDRSVAAARKQLGEKTFAAAWAQGRMMTPEQVVAAQGKATLSTPTPLTSPLKTTPSSHANPAGLTKREMDVLQLVAQGLTDAQVAEELVITRRTVNWYLTSIYSKIQVSSRSAATRYAVDHHLV